MDNDGGMKVMERNEDSLVGEQLSLLDSYRLVHVGLRVMLMYTNEAYF